MGKVTEKFLFPSVYVTNLKGEVGEVLKMIHRNLKTSLMGLEAFLSLNNNNNKKGRI